MDPLYDQIATYPCIVQTFPDLILYLAGLKTSWEHSPKKPVIYHWGQVDGELNFLPAEVASEGRKSPFTKSVNNNALVIDATSLSFVYPSNVVENVIDSNDPSYGEDEQTLIGHPKASKKIKILGKRKVAGKASTPLDVDRDFKIHEFPSTKELKDATDCYWVVVHVTPPSWKLHLREISIEQLCYIHDRAYMRQAILDNLEKDRAYAELERKIEMRKADRAAVISKVVPDAAMKLIRSDDLGYRPSSKEEYKKAGDALANASYPFLAEYVANPYASLEQLLSKKPPLLRPTFSRSCSKPLSPKVK
ncbi:hypothetical protein Tco_0915860 [Tanacetum coccineum]